MNQSELNDLATRYAAAWSSQSPEDLASFYAEDGSLTVNAGTPSVGRAAIAATAGEFMAAFPDMVVKMDSVSLEGSHATFHWTWTGTNTGPGGTGKSVRISGYEVWTLSADGLIAESKGNYDEAEYQRQMGGDGGGSSPESWATIDPGPLNLRVEEAIAAEESWPSSPLLLTIHLFGGDQEVRSVSLEETKNRGEGADAATISYRRDGLMDDSVRGDWHEVDLRRLPDGSWRVGTARVAYSCRRSEDPELFQKGPCP